MNNRNISTFSPFITFCQHVIPLAYDESMSYYETLCALRDYLVNTVIPAVNNNADAVTELQNKYTEFTNNINEIVNNLEDYMDNYFNNLDVQTEINNKLDEMAEDGQLQDIIAQYLKLASVLAFNTRNDLKNANNLNEGSFTYCFGKDTYNDGYGAFYKIRKSINTDVADGENLIALTNFSDLIAEKMPDKYLEDVETNFTNEIENINNTISQLDEKIENFEKTMTTIVIGDSYTADDSVAARDGATSWVEQFKTFTKNNVKNMARGGSGFVADPYDTSMTFDEQYMTVINDDSIDNSLIDTIIIYGGLNDINTSTITEPQILNNAKILAGHIKQYTPHAKVYCAFFNLEKAKNDTRKIKITNNFMNQMSTYGWILNKSAGWLKGNNSECYASDSYHPNETGSKRICECMVAFINNTIGPVVPVTFEGVKLTSPDLINFNFDVTSFNQICYYPLIGRCVGNIACTANSEVVGGNNSNVVFTAVSNLDASNNLFNPCSGDYDMVLESNPSTHVRDSALFLCEASNFNLDKMQINWASNIFATGRGVIWKTLMAYVDYYIV